MGWSCTRAWDNLAEAILEAEPELNLYYQFYLCWSSTFHFNTWTETANLTTEPELTLQIVHWAGCTISCTWAEAVLLIAAVHELKLFFKLWLDWSCGKNCSWAEDVSSSSCTSAKAVLPAVARLKLYCQQYLDWSCTTSCTLMKAVLTNSSIMPLATLPSIPGLKLYLW